VVSEFRHCTREFLDSLELYVT